MQWIIYALVCIGISSLALSWFFSVDTTSVEAVVKLLLAISTAIFFAEGSEVIDELVAERGKNNG